jgi:hypothetical protein
LIVTADVVCGQYDHAFGDVSLRNVVLHDRSQVHDLIVGGGLQWILDEGKS